MGLINSPDNGATEVPGTSNTSIFVFLAGPIRHWWAPGMWDSEQHRMFNGMREFIHRELSDEFLVYAPHRAWRGPWDDRAQGVNDAAVKWADAFVKLSITGVVATGTEEECRMAEACHIPIFEVNCDSWQEFLPSSLHVYKALLAMRDDMMSEQRKYE